MDDLELLVKYQEACREGGLGADVICDAVEADPMPRLDQATLEEGFAVRAARTSPEQTTKMRHIMQVRDALSSALREAMQELIDAGLPADDPLSVIARGSEDPET